MTTIKFAIIGMGRIGKRHAAMIQSHDEAELMAICDIDNNKSQGFSDTPFFEDIDALLKTAITIDVVAICTPNGLHATHALKALKAKKHVVIEKPMTLTKAEAELVIFKSLEVSKQVFCVMQNRYSPPAKWLKQIITEKQLGETFMVGINCYWNRDERYYGKNDWHGTADLDGGVLFTQFSHFIDMMYWLFGDITNIQARFADFNHKDSTAFEDSGLVNFEFINGGLGYFNYSTSVWNQNFESSITVIGSKGTVKIGGQYMEKIEYCHIENYEIPTLPPSNPPNNYGGYKGSAANHSYVIDNVINVLKGKESITTNALEGLKVIDIIERIYSNK